MATLDDRPTIDPALASWPAVRPVTDFGPEWIDAETVAELGRQIESGITFLSPEVPGLVAEAPQEVLEDLFSRHLHASPLSSGFVLVHRVFALVAALDTLAGFKRDGFAASGAPGLPARGTMQVGIHLLEERLGQARSMIGRVLQVDPGSPTVDLVTAKMALLDVEDVTALTGVTQAQLAAWRASGRGPAYVKVGGQRRSIRYPVALFIEWMYGVLDEVSS